jgi:hypothetical protein
MITAQRSLLLCTLVLGACVSQPAAVRPAATPVTAPVAPAPAAATAVAAAAAPAAAEGAIDGEERAAVLQYARNHKYKPVTRNGKQLWCKTEVVLGSRFERTSCASEETLADAYRQSRAESNSVSQVCTSVGCTGKQ